MTKAPCHAVLVDVSSDLQVKEHAPLPHLAFTSAGLGDDPDTSGVSEQAASGKLDTQGR